MSNFKVGDRVMCTKEDYVATPGEKGTIRVIEHHNDDRNFGVELDNDLGGHALDAEDGVKCKGGHGWWAAAENIRLLENRFEVGQIYRVGKLSSQHQYENSIVKLAGNRPFGFTVKAIRGEAPNDFGKCSEYGRSLTLLTGPQIGEAIRKWDDEHSANKTGVREVKRPAKPGEYIKIVSAWANEGYKNGDILKAIRRFNENSVVFDDTKICVCDDEYVVLEGYRLEQKEERRKAKVGDTIKVLHDNGGRVEAGTVWKVKSVNPNGDLSIVSDSIGGGFTWSCAADNYTILSSGKHSYTAEQIEKAKKLCGDMMVEALDDGNTFNIRILDKNYDEKSGAVTCDIARFNGASGATGNATCSDHDEYNVWIGRCVALCKALHKPVPAFIMGDGATSHFDFEKARSKGSNAGYVSIHCAGEKETRELMKELDALGYK